MRILRDVVVVLNKIGKCTKGVTKQCRFCNINIETEDHVFLQCPLNQAVLFASPLNMRINDPTVATVMNTISGWIIIKECDDYFYMGACMFWAIWKAINALVFENHKPYISNTIRNSIV